MQSAAIDGKKQPPSRAGCLAPAARRGCHPGAYGTQLIVDPAKGLAYVMMIHRPNFSDNFENETSRAFLQAATDALAKSK